METTSLDSITKTYQTGEFFLKKINRTIKIQPTYHSVMKKFAALLFVCFMVLLAHSQNSFVFSCTRDTTLTCSNNCITLRALVPNIKDYSGTYKVVKTSGPGGCFVPPVAPDLPGLPTNLSQDDRYTTLIGLPFMFPFYGAAYTDAVVSTNGVICFDATKATSFAHYGI